MLLKHHLDMVHKALVKSGYLTGEETPEELKNLLPDAAANLLTDLFHLFREANGRMTSKVSHDIWNSANKKYEEDGFTLG